jgi:hypothetical protein
MWAACAALAACAPPVDAVDPDAGAPPEPDAGAAVLAPPALAPRAALPPALGYHGGHVMAGTNTLYFIWYGTWSWWGPYDTTTILYDFASHLGGSPWFGINTGYYDRFGGRVKNELRVGAMAVDPYDHGTYLDGTSTMLGVVQASTDNGVLPLDPNGIYVVVASGDVSDPWVCRSACAWHDHGPIHGKDVKVVFLNDTSRCTNVCPIYGPSPNGNGMADMMVTYLAHEVAETVSDPAISAWYNQEGTSRIENGDRCAWNFGAWYQLANGAAANMWLYDRYYLVQQLWVNENPGWCAMSW